MAFTFNDYLEAVYGVMERGMAAKEVVCSITTGFRSIPSLRTKPGLNPYHATVADIGYGFDSVQGTIDRLRAGENFPLAIEMLVFEIDTLGISQQQITPNFELAVKGAGPEVNYLVEESRRLNRQIQESIQEAIKISQDLLGSEWVKIHSRIQNIQAIPRL